MFKKLQSVNWMTTLAGVAALAGVVGKVGVAYKTKDFGAIFSSGTEVMTDVTAVALGLGLIVAKDYNTTGAGDTAVKK